MQNKHKMYNNFENLYRNKKEKKNEYKRYHWKYPENQNCRKQIQKKYEFIIFFKTNDTQNKNEKGIKFQIFKDIQYDIYYIQCMQNLNI